MVIKINYKEGSLFSVPLRSGGFGVGLVARSTKRGPIILAYLFNKKFTKHPELTDLPSFSAKDAATVIRVGDLGLIRGEWKILGDIPNWDRSLWKFPKFIRREPFTGRILLVTFSEDDPAVYLYEERITEEEARHLGLSSVSGAGAAEIHLTEVAQLGIVIEVVEALSNSFCFFKALILKHIKSRIKTIRICVLRTISYI